MRRKDQIVRKNERERERVSERKDGSKKVRGNVKK